MSNHANLTSVKSGYILNQDSPPLWWQGGSMYLRCDGCTNILFFPDNKETPGDPCYTNNASLICGVCWDYGRKFSDRTSEEVIVAKQKERRGEVAILFLKVKFLKDSLGAVTSIREIGNMAKQAGVPTEEAKEFAQWLLRDIIAEAFPKEGSSFKGGVSKSGYIEPNSS